MHYTKSFFAHIRQQRSEAKVRHKWPDEEDMSKSNGGPVKTERVKMSASQMDAKIQRGVKALKAGYQIETLIERGFTADQIKRVVKQRDAEMGK
jgi:hypothetical protein